EPCGARRLPGGLRMAGLLELERVTAGYGGGDILHELDLSVEDGGITCIVGPNGAGKSTILRVVSGLLRPRLGAIRFRGASIVGLTPRAILQRGIVQVPQERSLFPTMTVWENVRMGAYTERDQRLIDRRLEEVCEAFTVVRERAGAAGGRRSGGAEQPGDQPALPGSDRMSDWDIIVAGAGHNSLLTAAYAARAGFKVMVLEGAREIGGDTSCEEMTLPGFIHDPCATAHNLIQSNPLMRENELQLDRYGLKYLYPDPVFAMPFRDGRSITMWRDLDR